MKQKFIDLYFDIAERISELSYAKRLKVGAVIVKNNRILSYGYNGTPAGFDNDCEYWDDGHIVTKPEVIHAEMNAILKVTKSTESTEGSDLFLTHSPCMNCAKIVYQAGVSNLYYIHDYRDSAGLDFLRVNGIAVIKRSAAQTGDSAHPQG